MVNAYTREGAPVALAPVMSSVKQAEGSGRGSNSPLGL